MQPLDAEQIRGSLVNLSKTKAKALALPPVADVDWANRDYFGWYDGKAPSRAYLVAPHYGGHAGLALRVTPARKRSGTALCNLCHCTQPADRVALFTAAKPKATADGSSVGTYICADLACSLYLRGLLPLEHKYGQGVPLEERVEGLVGRLRGFVESVLR